MSQINHFDPRGKKFLVITAHADDADFTCGGTLLKWINLGAKGAIVIATNGDKGSHDDKISSSQLKVIRKQEQLKASQMLGLEHTWFLDFPDAHLEISQNLKERLVKIIRSYRPDIILTWDPSLPYSTKRNMVVHPDHRAIGQAALDACFPMARDQLTFESHKSEGLEAHCVENIFLINFDNPNYFEDVSDFIDKKIQLLKLHESQVNKETIESSVKDWAKETGSVSGFKYAEGFVYLSLKSD